MRATLLSWFYRSIRRCVLLGTKDLETAITLGDHAYIRLKPLKKWIYHFSIPKHIGVSLYDLSFPSPLTLAAFKDDPDILHIWMQFGLGGATIKTLLKEPRPGNPHPRITEVTTPEGKGLLNAMGLPGKGISKFIESLPTLTLFSDKKPIGISIGGNSLEDYQDNFLKLDHALQTLYPGRYYLELNISCPNTPEGQDLSKNPTLLEALLRFIRNHSNTIVGVKLSPDQPNDTLLTYGKLIASFPRTYINIGNTSFRKCDALGLPSTAISIGGGGLSGPALFKRTLDMTTLLAPLGCPIMATGGISKPEHVLALKKKGALLFGLATAVVQDPYCIPKLNRVLVP